MASPQPIGLDVVSPEDQRFFKTLGTRIAELRKAQNFTQQQLADLLGLSQQMIASYEVGRRRVPISMLRALATALAVSIDTLLGTGTSAAKRGPTPKLHQQIERISQLPRAQQRFVTQMLDTVIAQASRQKEAVMNTLVIEHLTAAELPRQWAEQLKATPDATFTVRIEAEEAAHTDHAAFGLWQDREDLGDVDAYLRDLRQPRR